MDPITTLWLASLVGAAIFTAAGWFLARAMWPEPEPEIVEREVIREVVKEVEKPSIAVLDDAGEMPDQPAKSDLRAEIAKLRAEKEEAERHLQTMREELRSEILARKDAEKRAHAAQERVEDLMRRLDGATQQVAAMRARHGANDEMRRASLTPAAPRTSMTPVAANPQRMASLAPGLFAELEDLRREVGRLKRENESLRAEALLKRGQ